MLTLIHGDDTTASRNYFFEEKQHYPDALRIEGSAISPTDLQQYMSGQDLFGQTKAIFIDTLISKRKSPKEIAQLIEVINLSPDTPIFLWESKELTKKQIELFKKITVKLFKIPSTIFALLDALKPNNGQVLLDLFHKTLLDKDAEFVLVMLERQIRILLAICGVIPAKAGIQKEDKEPGSLIKSGMTISEVSRLATWQKGKLEKQATLFTAQQLLQLHNALFHLEKNMKTGNLSLPLDKSIDLLLLSL
ncbi:MAG TPA: hypothetical protein VLB73_01680 [Patescibacteria group bacterium]|nr:hypothetical protein [Patescibacteria group bacterium]